MDQPSTPNRRPPFDPSEEPKTASKPLPTPRRVVGEKSSRQKNVPETAPTVFADCHSKGKFTATGFTQLAVCFVFEFERGLDETKVHATRFKVDCKTIDYWRKKWIAGGRKGLEPARRTPPPVDTDAINERRELIKQILEDKDQGDMPKYNTCEAIRLRLFELFQVAVGSRATIFKDLQALKATCMMRMETCALETMHIAKRLAFSKLVFPPAEDILFSDESWFFAGDHRKTQWVLEGQTPTLLPVEKRGDKKMKLMVFAIIGIDERALTFAEGSVNSEAYIKMLEKTLLPIVKRKPHLWFMQDMASCHTSAQTAEWFKAHNIKVLPWPPRGADLNPIEHFWAIFKRRCASQFITEPAGLRKEIEATFAAVPKKTVDNLVLSFPKRIECLKRTKGESIVAEYKKFKK